MAPNNHQQTARQLYTYVLEGFPGQLHPRGCPEMLEDLISAAFHEGHGLPRKPTKKVSAARWDIGALRGKATAAVLKACQRPQIDADLGRARAGGKRSKRR